MAADKSNWVVTKVLAEQARVRGDSPFIQYEDDPPFTYAQADRIGNQVGNALAKEGVQFGENVAVMLHNRLEYLWAWFGLNRIGAVHVGINTAYKGGFLTHVLANAGSRYAVMEPEFLEWLADIEDTVPNMETVFVPGDALAPDQIPNFKRITVRSFNELMSGSPDPINVDVTYRDIGVIMYTSGTTGPSKGVLMPHGHLYLFGYGKIVHMGLGPEDRYYCCMPLFHAQAMLMQVYGTLIAGASVVLAKQFRASTWIDDVRRHRATVTNTLGVMNDFILKQPEKASDKDHELRLLCAVPVTEETLGTLRSRFGIPKFSELFGMTEVNIPVWRPLDAPDEAGCSGPVWDEYFEVIIADPDSDEEVPRGEVGEILVRPKEPYCFMQGYNGMDDRTVETWRNFWFHTGDAGRMDERGYVWYIDRIKDTIRRRGENISSYEVEAVLLEYPGVIEVAAVAVKAEEGGEDEVLACLVMAPDSAPPKPEAILDFCQPRMPYFAIPRYIDFVSSIPKTPTQKIQKNKLREIGLSTSAWDREAVGYKVRR